jgi:mxaA protein
MRRGVLLLAALAVPQAAVAEVRAVHIEEPRPFGYFLGDLIERTAEIETAPDDTIVPASMPRTGPSNYWLELKGVTQSTARGGDSAVHRLKLAYQTFYAPIDPRKVTIPATEITVRTSAGIETATIPPFTLIMSPLREIFPEKGGETADTFLRPDAPVPLRRSGFARTGALIAGGLSALLLLLLARHFAWWPFARRPTRPFSRAAREVAQALSFSERTQGYKTALLALHRAFDTAAGRRLLAGDVETFLTVYPHHAPSRSAVERFFEASRTVFFGEAQRQGETQFPPVDLSHLAVELARQERTAR